MGWLAAFHAHHDHGTNPFRGDLPGRAPRFAETILCDQCNAADGRAKRQLGLPADWSFSPAELAQFVTATPHGSHAIDLETAATIHRTALAARAR